ncbi:hypothetical protein CH63R_13265 [Colletotrichum higginsianum IMI 349063]|uniref:Uncharacterized protein n=1 Tax=Colletotrichum higginsianum (strain IMI 349063) TaxID=759273 RepID=A0A1B7XWK8_COLHI|nr:hypothetical protein CH63R_13265 [Colletotrichum higginsianum IMI 349063]OBR04138.1 hypothetical protein CH63R_13265 [Colletotrichum higginsianum IMI 349063]
MLETEAICGIKLSTKVSPLVTVTATATSRSNAETTGPGTAGGEYAVTSGVGSTFPGTAPERGSESSSTG